MSRGFVDSGRFVSTFAVESDSRAAETYAANFPDAVVECRPIQQIEHFPQADVVIGGPPCQGFSTLNRRGADVASRRLWQEYLRGLLASTPDVFVMENVPQILDSSEFGEFLDSVERVGRYSVEAQVLNVADYGVPQRRLRAFIVGTRLADIHWPDQTHADPELQDRRYEPWVTFNQAVKGLPKRPQRQVLASGAQSATRKHPPLQGGPARGQPVRYGAPARRARSGTPCSAVLAEAQNWVIRRIWAPLGESSCDHNPHRVPQAGERSVPAPDRGPSDHCPRSGAPHGLPERVRPARSPAHDRGSPPDR